MLRFVTVALALASTTAGAQTLQASATYTLSTTLSDTSSNFHPQGLGIDESTGRLLYAQQTTNIYSSALDGSDVQLYATVNKSHVTSVAKWAGEVYITDYGGNGGGQDMFRTTPPSGSVLNYGSYVAAYGGFPIDIRDGELYRTNLSTSYSWANLNQMVITDVATPNGGSRTFTLSGTNGVGDFAVDLDSNSIWVLEYSGSARIHRYDLQSTSLLATSQVVGDGLDAGLTYYNGNLYYYDWVSGSGSTLTVFPTGFVAGCTDGMDPFDLDDDGNDDSCIHPTATLADSVTVEPGARIHANAIIASNAIVGGNANIGAGSIVGRHAEVRGTLEGAVTLGRSVQVLNGSTIADGSLVSYASIVDDSDLGPNTVTGNLVSVLGSSVGDDGGVGNAVLARGTTVQTGSTVGSSTVIGPECTLTNTTVGESVRVRKNSTFASGASVGDSARVGRDVTVGTSGSVAASARVGAQTQIAANACATGTVRRGSSITTCTP